MSASTNSLNKLTSALWNELIMSSRAPDVSRFIMDLMFRALSYKLVIKDDPSSKTVLRTSFGTATKTVLKIERAENIVVDYPCLYPWRSFIKTRNTTKVLNNMANYDVEKIPDELRTFISEWMTDWVLTTASKCDRATSIIAHWLREIVPCVDMNKLTSIVDRVKLAKANALNSKEPIHFVPIADTPGGKVLKDSLTTNDTWMTTTLADLVIKKKEEEAHLMWKLFIDAARNEIFYFERDSANPELLRSTILSLSASHREAYRTTLRSVATDDSYEVFVRQANGLMLERQQEKQSKLQRTSAVLALFLDAKAIQEQFKNYLETLAKKLSKYSVDANVPDNLKSLYRVLEKTAYNDFDVKNVFDVVRGALEFNSMKSMVLALTFLSSDKNITIVRIKDRFGKPTDGGWSDCLINAFFVNDPNQHVFEIQLLHQQMMFVRKTCGAHHTYNAFRTAIELQ